MAAQRPPVLIGRASERRRLDALLEDVRADHSAVLVVRGEAGVGKTALLGYCARQASGFRVARVTGVESEMELPFAGLHQLCAPLLDRVGALPEPQRAALGVALGRSFGAAPDRFLVALATLGLLAEAAAEGPLLCLIDDAQWLDAASSQVLGFVARRLLAESIAMVFAIREPSPARNLAGLPQLALGGLSDQDARALLATVTLGPLDERVRERLVAETRGNPLAIQELPRGLAATQAPAGFGLLESRALSAQIEESFQRRLAALPAATRSLLLVAAAEPIDDPLRVWRAAERLGIPRSTECTDGLLSIDERVTFLHPLVRSAVYRSASPRERRAVHLALAEVTDSEADADRRAWHLAAGATGPEEAVAAELERSAARAQARGGLAAAAAFLRRSVALTVEPQRRVERALAAAQACVPAGAFDAALELLTTAESGELDAFQRARVDLLRGQIAFASGLGRDAPPLLLNAARRLEALDLTLARDIYMDALTAALFAGPAGADDLLEICRAARAHPPPAKPRAIDVLLDGLSLLYTEGHGTAAPALLQATRDFGGNDLPVEEHLRWGLMAMSAATANWDYDGLRAVCARQVRLARDVGALDKLPIYLVAQAQVTIRAGDFAATASLIAEANAVTEATGTRMAPYPDLELASLQGNDARASALIEAAIAQAEELGQGLAITHAHWASAVLCNGRGHYEAALEAAQLANSAAHDHFAAMWALPELVEAASRTGAHELARDAVQRLAATTRPAGTDFGLGVEARSRALLSEGSDAEHLYLEAIERFGRTPLRTELARAYLVYGEWLRREGRRSEAREQLRTADDMFSAIGMEAFAARARRELLATGAKVRKRSSETRDELTAQEQQIARLARDGLSNAQIGAQLFLSPRTVEWHLNKVFIKLGITSRRGLHDALPVSDSEVTAA